MSVTPTNSIQSTTPSSQPTTSDKHPKSGLLRRLESLAPWRMNIQITEQVSTGQVLAQAAGTQQGRDRSNARTKFLGLVDALYPHGMMNKKFLDCGCNAGGFCFWAREKEAQFCFGFDIKEHWIRQARFLRNRRNVFPANRIQFEVYDLYDLPDKNLDPFDFVHFKDLFNHLPEPMAGLRIAADYSKDLLFFASPFVLNRPDGSLVMDRGIRPLIHGRNGELGWLPTGSGVCAEIIRNLGFEEIKLIQSKRVRATPLRGRLEIIAAREKSRLKQVPGTLL